MVGCKSRRSLGGGFASRQCRISAAADEHVDLRTDDRIVDYVSVSETNDESAWSGHDQRHVVLSCCLFHLIIFLIFCLLCRRRRGRRSSLELLS